jgi:oxalate decarboxylase/phosphoglucose isomerase-like protein (cupin superfamily)
MASGWLELEPLKRKPFLRTEEGDEILAVLKGVCRVRVVLDERTAEKYVVRGGDVFLVPKMCFYEVKNTSTEEVAVLLFVVGVGETMVPQRR